MSSLWRGAPGTSRPTMGADRRLGMVGADVPGSPRARCVRAGAPGTQRKNRKRQERRARGYREGHRISAGLTGRGPHTRHPLQGRAEVAQDPSSDARRLHPARLLEARLRRRRTRHRRFAGQLPQVHRKAVGKMTCSLFPVPLPCYSKLTWISA